MEKPIIELRPADRQQMSYSFARSQKEKADILRLSRRFLGLTPEAAATVVNNNCRVVSWPENNELKLTGADMLRFESNELVISNDLIRACVKPVEAVPAQEAAAG